MMPITVLFLAFSIKILLSVNGMILCMQAIILAIRNTPK